jgi:hypothetical protein
MRLLVPTVLLQNARQVELCDGPLRRRCGRGGSRRVRAQRVSVRVLDELVAFAGENSVGESGRLIARGLGIPRKGQRIAIDTCDEGERRRIVAAHAGGRAAFQKIDTQSGDAAYEILPNVRGKPTAIVGVPLFRQLALLRQEAQRQTDQENARSAKCGEKQQRRARRPEDHGRYSTDSAPSDLS